MPGPRAHWDEVAASYDRYRSLDGATEEAWVGRIVAMAGLAPGDTLLDVGCGTGRLAIPLRGRGLRVVGLDTSGAMLRQARGKDPALPLVRGTAGALPFRSQAFAAALAAFVLHHVPDLQAALAEMAGVARALVIVTLEVPPEKPDILYEAFPTLLTLEARRFPAVEVLAAGLRAVGLARVEVQRGGPPRRQRPGELLAAVRARYISSLALLPEAEFEAGLRFLEAELPRRFPHGVERGTSVVFLAGRP